MVVTNKKTWLDWYHEVLPGMPDPATETLLSREEFLEDLNERGIDVNDVTLVYWEKEGLLPRALRRWRGAAQALYPPWLWHAVAYLRSLRDHGIATDDIRSSMKILMQSMATWITTDRNRTPIDECILVAYAGYDHRRSDNVMDDMEAFAAAVRPLLDR